MGFEGKVHLYYGDGKGKTTAAVGLALRAFGAGFAVLAVQFLKDGKSPEIELLREKLGIPVLAEKRTAHMSYAMTEEEKAIMRECHERIWRETLSWANSGGEDPDRGRLLVLDEIIGAIEADLFDESELIDFLDSRPSGLEVVLTGRNPSEAVLERADYRSRIANCGHPYDKGTPARKGIEY